ncbi:MAG TPA: KH domain-containing protein [Candidatus Saccharibacteria bacterium]|jgi:predicted RNA-binding protein YlqC (UPF0109 family)|nr:KH domain-containing protein [Candidatus Saccharibacteria bacterium]HMT55823.1 KH domain-containing protein [Candidatus Saccharibacteria bacterium]
MSETTIDQQFIEYVVKSLVGKPEAVKVERIIDEKGVLLTLTVDPEDLGRVIGKRGATAQSLRTLLRALGTKNEARYNLKIVDNGIPREERNASTSNDEGGWSSSPVANTEETFSAHDDTTTVDTSAAEDAARDSGEEESAIARTRRELEDLDDLDV